MSKQSAIALDAEGVLACLPHRYPFLFIDCVTELVLGERITAIKNVTLNEPFFTGHFPSRPIMPGVLMIEALAQAAALLGVQTHKAQSRSDDEVIFFLAGVNNAKFRRAVVPGDQLLLSAEVTSTKRNFIKYKAVASVADKMACSVEIMGAFGL